MCKKVNFSEEVRLILICLVFVLVLGCQGSWLLKNKYPAIQEQEREDTEGIYYVRITSVDYEEYEAYYENVGKEPPSHLFRVEWITFLARDKRICELTSSITGVEIGKEKFLQGRYDTDSQGKVMLADGTVGTLIKKGRRNVVKIQKYDPKRETGIVSGNIIIVESGVVVVLEKLEKSSFFLGQPIYVGGMELESLNEAPRKKIDKRINQLKNMPGPVNSTVEK